MGPIPQEYRSGLEADPRQSRLQADPYSKLEVDRAGPHHDTLPEVVPESDLIAVPHQSERASAASQKPNTICGLSRKAFWITLIAVVLIIVGAAVGGGVGASVNSKGHSDTSSNTSSSATGNSTTDRALLPNTRLATFNYTQNSVEYSCVFFQSEESSIYQTLWNSSAKTWMVVLAIENGSEIQPMQNTPLAASALYDEDASSTSFYLFFLDATSKLRAYKSSSLTGPWSAVSGLDGEINAPSTTPLLTYSIPTSYYVDSQFVVWQQSTKKLQLRCLSSSCGTQSQSDLDDVWPTPDLNSSLAMAPLYSRFNSSAPQLAMYGSSNGLWETHYGNLTSSDHSWRWNWQQSGNSLGVNDGSKMTTNASLAAFSIGWYAADGGNRTAPEHVQVLWTRSAAKGVSVLANKNEAWDPLQESVAAFNDVAAYSSIAANQAGKVYAVEDAGTAAQLAEWQFVVDGARYVRVGVVDTAVPQ